MSIGSRSLESFGQSVYLKQTHTILASIAVWVGNDIRKAAKEAEVFQLPLVCVFNGHYEAGMH